MIMQSYYVEYNYPQWSEGGGFKSSPDYYSYKHIVIKAQNIDNLRLRLIKEVAKGKPFRSHIYKLGMSGVPNYDAKIGDFYNYRDGYIWFIRDTGKGWKVNPDNGRRLI